VRALSAPASSRGPQRRGYPTSHIECGNARFKAFQRARPSYSSNPSPSHSEVTSVSTLECVREPLLLHSQAPAPGPWPAPDSLLLEAPAVSQPVINKETLTAPPTYIAFCNYVFLNGLKELRVYQIADALGYLKERGKPIKQAVKSWKQVYDAINRLMRDGVITRRERGEYAVNFEACVRYANAIPKAIGNRDYVALRGHDSILGLPPQWAIVLLQRQYFERALIDATQGTTPPSWPAQAIYPITKVVTPSGLRPTVIDLPDRYILPSKSLLHRSVVHCAYLGPKPVCSATPGQLYHYLAQPVYLPSPVVPYPVPVAPTKVVGPLADYDRHLIPLSALPHNARKYEVGYQVFDPFLFDFHQHFNAELKGRQGLIYLTVKSRHAVTSDVLAKVITSLPVLASYYLDILEQALNAMAEYGRSQLGLTTPALMASSQAVLSEALYRRPKPRPAKSAVTLLLVKEVRYRRNGQDYTVRRDLTLGEFTALLGELVDYSTERPFKLTYIEFTVVIPDRAGLALRLLGAGYLFIYYNANKDPYGAVRIEFRPYKRVTGKVTPQDLNVLFCGLAKALTLPLDLAKRAWARAWLAWGPHSTARRPLTAVSTKVWM